VIDVDPTENLHLLQHHGWSFKDIMKDGKFCKNELR
jgi:hypothetical protein